MVMACDISMAIVCDISMAMVCDIVMVLACFCWIWGGAWAFVARSGKSFHSQFPKAPWRQIPALAYAEWDELLNFPYHFGAVTWVRFVIFLAFGYGTWVNLVIFKRRRVCLESLRVRSWGGGVGNWVSWFEIEGSEFTWCSMNGRLFGAFKMLLYFCVELIEFLAMLPSISLSPSIALVPALATVADC